MAYVARNLKNRAGVRLLMACLVAKIHQPHVDIRKPYTEIGSEDAFSGRTYDEQFVTPFILEHELPCNPTTAFLTPALRNRHVTLTVDLNLVGRPPQLYQTVLQLLDAVYRYQISADDLLAETIRWLVLIRNEQQQRLQSLLVGLQTTQDGMPLSSEDIVNLLAKHLSLPGTSRLPVLMVTAVYQSAERYLGEQVLTLHAHTAADKQTGALGDVEITLTNDEAIVTSYEMKAKPVTKDDLNRALQKLSNTNKRVDNYIFITTDKIDEAVQSYAHTLYQQTSGIEFVILDCIEFVRHFLHLFHRIRMPFLETYQTLMVAEPHSAISQPLKEAFLAMRQAAEIEDA